LPVDEARLIICYIPDTVQGSTFFVDLFVESALFAQAFVNASQKLPKLKISSTVHKVNSLTSFNVTFSEAPVLNASAIFIQIGSSSMKLNLLKGIYSTSYSPNVIGKFSVWYRWDFSKWILSSTFVSVVNASSSGSICSIETRVGLVSYSNSFRVFLSDSINPTHAKVAGSVQKLQRKFLHSDDRISYDIVVRSDILGENTVDIFNQDDVSLCSVTFYLHAVMVISSFLPSVSVSSSFRASIFGGPFLHDWKYFCIVDRAFVIPAVVIDHSVLQCLIHVDAEEITRCSSQWMATPRRLIP